MASHGGRAGTVVRERLRPVDCRGNVGAGAVAGSGNGRGTGQCRPTRFDAREPAALCARDHISDARALLRGELVELQRLVQNATNRTNDAMTRLHLRDINLEITRILDPRP